MIERITKLGNASTRQFFVKIGVAFEKFLQLVVIVYVLSVFIAAYASIPLILTCLWYCPRCRPIFAAYLYWIRCSSTKAAHNNRRRFSRFSWIRLGRYYREYFPVSLIKTGDLYADRNYVLVVYPHSFQAHSVIVNFLTKCGDVDDLYPDVEFHVVALKLYFYLPILREHLLALGACPASEHSLTSLLRSNPSKAAVLLAGGAREVTLQRPGRTYTIIKSRKGFVRVALKTGTSLVPAFSFGENRIFDQCTIDSPWYVNILDRIHRMTGLRVVLPKGRGFFQNTLGLLPRRSPINVVVGKPINVPKVENPSDDIVDKYHRMFFHAVERLFDEYKERYDPCGREARLKMV